MNKKCETCIKRKTMYCPNSIECWATDDKPYYRNKIMLLEENQFLKKQLEEIDKFKFSYRKDETKIPPIIRKQKDVEIIKNLKNQQKEFINYLEDNYKETQDIWYIKILQKYEEIIGGVKNDL